MGRRWVRLALSILAIAIALGGLALSRHNGVVRGFQERFSPRPGQETLGVVPPAAHPATPVDAASSAVSFPASALPSALAAIPIPREAAPAVSPAPSFTPSAPAPISSTGTQVSSAFWLRGVVVTPDHQPVRQFAIQVSSSDGQALAPDAPTYEKTIDSPTGEFEISLRQAGLVTVVARAKGFVPGVLPYVTLARSREEAEPLEIMLIPGGGIHGSVLNEAGQPVPEALVEFGQYAYSVSVSMPDGEVETPETRAAIEQDIRESNPNPWQLTDPQGHFELTDLPQGTYSLNASHEGYFPVTREVKIHPGETLNDIQVVLSNRGGAITVQVMDAAGSPMAGQKVGIDGGGRQVEGLTDDQGRWRVEQLAPGTYRTLMLTKSSGQTEASSGTAWRRSTVELKAGSEANVTFQVISGATVSGEVDRAGQPVPGLEVTASETNSAPGTAHDTAAIYTTATASTDSAGHFELRDLLPGQYALSVVHGEERATVSLTLMPSDQRRTLQIHLGMGRLEGTVKDGATGLPIAAASVRLTLTNAMEDQPNDVFHIIMKGEAATDANGMFQIDELPLGTYLLDVAANGYGRVSQQLEVAGATVRQSVSLLTGGVLVVTVTNPNQLPLAGMGVTVVSLENSFSQWTSSTDERGLVDVRDLAPGSYEVLVASENGAESFRRIVNIRSGEVERLAVRIDVNNQPTP